MAPRSAESLSEYSEIVSKLFGSEEEGFQFYNKYALEKGFSVRKCYVEWDEANEEIILRKFVCCRQGFREVKHMMKENRKIKARNITRVGCPAKIMIAQNQETRQWYVKDFIDEHNHDLATRELACLLRSHRRISDEQKASIIELQISGIRKHQIRDILEVQYGGFDKVGYKSRDIYNFTYHYKQQTIAAGDARTVIRHLTARQDRDPEFFFEYLVDRAGHLTGLFWTDSQCQLDYEAFGDVVVFDSTYRTNRYNMPFVPFVGLNHHRSTVIFGCGIISHETNEAYEWMLRTFSDAMAKKHPISVITDGDLAMQRAIRVVWPNSNHRLCIWHIEHNVVRNLHDDDVREEFRKFIYDCCSTEELERKWEEFLEKNKVSSQDNWLHQMYQMRNLWCAAYQEGRCFLGLRSNQRSESLNSTLHTHLDGKMTLFEMLLHYEFCLAALRRNEAMYDAAATQSVPFTELDASTIEKHAAQVFTPTVFDLVKWSIHAASKNVLIEVLDGGDILSYIVARKDSREKEFEVHCVLNEAASLCGISCSCRKLECKGTPCSHIFYVLGLLQIEQLPKCCIQDRWTMSAKSAFPPTRKNSIYDYSKSLERYRELRNLSHAASFKASQSNESYERMKHVLQGEAGTPSSRKNESMRYGPVLPQKQQSDSGNGVNVLDPEHVKGRGAPKKRLQAMKKTTSTRKCGRCNLEGHNRRTCSKKNEKNKVPESW